MTLRGMDCCGLRELHGLEGEDNPKQAMLEFYRAAYPNEQRFDYNRMKYVRTPKRVNFSHVIFSEALEGYRGEMHYGQRFASFIQRNGLGHVAISLRRVNPNSQNRLKVWVWTINKEAVKAWGEKHSR